MCSGSQVVNTFHLVERVVSLQNSSGNVHQILPSMYFRGAAAESVGEGFCPHPIPKVL